MEVEFTWANKMIFVSFDHEIGSLHHGGRAWLGFEMVVDFDNAAWLQSLRGQQDGNFAPQCQGLTGPKDSNFALLC